MTTPPVDLGEFLAGYLAEVDEHLGSAMRNLLAVEANLQRGAPSPRPVRELYRSLHTIKGLSAMVGVEPVVEIAHVMEAVLRTADREGGVLPDGAVDDLGRGLQAIDERVRVLERHQGLAAVAPAPPELLDALSRSGRIRAAPGAGVESAADQPGASAPAAAALPAEIADKLTISERRQLDAGIAEGRRAVRVDFVPTPARAAAGDNITAVRERLAQLGELVKVVPLSRTVGPDAPGGLAFAVLMLTDASAAQVAAAASVTVADVMPLYGPAAAAAPEDGGAGGLGSLDDVEAGIGVGTRGVVRVEVDRLDDAMEKLSALVVTRFRIERELGELAARGTEVRALAAVVQENGRQLKALRGAIMRARMIAAAELLERVPLLVRRLGQETGRELRLEVDAAQGELDKAVAERVFPAVVHLLRNAVDHGIEPPAEREAAGKPRQGHIVVTCFERGSNQLELTIEDDGRGIDAEALARRAGRPVPATPEALLALLTLPGLSSREEATMTSGRGMGMDIVRRVVVEELGGELGVRTARGRGTTFVLRLPLTITIVEALSFSSGRQAFVAPVAGVDEIIAVEEREITWAPSGPNRAELRMLTRRGAPMPLVSLAGVFRLPDGERSGQAKAIVVRRNGQPVAFEVDRLLGRQEVVVRPLLDPLVRAPGIVGATDLGDGQPTLVLDLVALCGRLSRRRTDLRAAAADTGSLS